MITTNKRINIWCNFVGGGWSPTQKFLAGTENFVRQFAEESARRGFIPTVYQNGFVGQYRGVEYRSHYDLDTMCDVFLIIKEPTLLDIPLKAKRVIYYTNDIFDREKLTPKRVSKVEKIIALSNYHKDYLLQGVDKVQVVYHGITPVTVKEKVPYQCLYASSPDRGLSFLESIWPDIVREFPQATLKIAYNGKTDKEMEDLYATSDYWLYPCQGIELYCITGIRAQAHGCYPIVTPHMALTETVRYGLQVPLTEYKDAVLRTLKTRDEDTELYTLFREQVKSVAWPSVESEWEQIMV